MTTAKNDVFIGLQLKIFYLDQEIDFWWGGGGKKNWRGRGRGVGLPEANFSRWAGEGMSTFLAVGRDFPPRGLPHPHPSSRENPAVITKMEHFAILVNDFQLFAIVAKSSILNVVGFLDPPLPCNKFAAKAVSWFKPKRMVWCICIPQGKFWVA